MERTGAKAEHSYQSGKIRRRNANKKKCLQRRWMMAQSAMASPAQNLSIQVVDLDVPNELSNLSMSVNSTTKAHSGDTLIAELKQTEKAYSGDTLIAELKQTVKAHCSDHIVVLMKETAEVSVTQETAISVMETTETESVCSDKFYDAQIVEDDEETFEEYEPEQVNLGYTARCVRIKDNTFAYAGQTGW